MNEAEAHTNGGALAHATAVHPAGPLHLRVPKRDAHGRPYGDFMMLIPGLASKPRHLLERTVAELELVLAQLGDLVVFADLNLRLNVLWVTVVPGRDIGIRVAAAIHARVPEAKLVAAHVRYA